MCKADGRRLGPAIGSQRSEAHGAMLIEQTEYLILKCRNHGITPGVPDVGGP